MSDSNNKAVVIGSGVAGLALAIRLANLGFEVEVFEANDYAGGKIFEWRNGGYRFCMRSSVFTIPKDALGGWLSFGKLKVFRNINDSNTLNISYNHTVKLFYSFAGNMGSDPFNAPGALNLISHFKFNAFVSILFLRQ